MRLDVLKAMVDANMDIRATSTVVEAKTVKAGGVVSFGVDRKTLNDVALDRMRGSRQYTCVAFFFNTQQYEAMLKQNENKF